MPQTSNEVSLVKGATYVTDIGKELISAAVASGGTVKFKYFAVGDGDGSEYEPTGHETQLVHENWRVNIGNIIVDPKDKKAVIIDTPIPEDVGGWFVREYGIFDEDNNLILIGTVNTFYKPPKTESIFIVDMKLSLSLKNVSTVQFIIDPQAYVTHSYLKTADYTIEGQTEYAQRPKCENSVFATKADIEGLVKFPDIQDDGKGVVIIQQPDGSGAVMRFLDKAQPDIYTEIDGKNGEVRIVGGTLTGYSE